MASKENVIAPASAAPPAAQLATISHAADKNWISFLDLPPEIRNQIYEEALPNLAPECGLAGKALSSNSAGEAPKSWWHRQLIRPGTTSFMATCRQVYEEAVTVLYRSKELGAVIWADRSIEFCGVTTPFTAVRRPVFSALNYIAKLDFLFEFLASGYKLQELKMIIEDLMNQEMPFIRYLQNYVAYGLESVQPGAITPAHVVAFLTDPLCTVHNLDNKTDSGFTLLLANGYKSGIPWADSEREMQAVVQKGQQIAHYTLFRPYFKTLREVVQIIESCHRGITQTWNPLVELASTRVRGDAVAFRRAQFEFIGIADGIARRETACMPSAWRKKLEQMRCDVIFQMLLLEQRLPAPDADTSFFGFSETDRKLREWQSGGKLEEKVAKAERKRKRAEKSIRVPRRPRPAGLRLDVGHNGRESTIF